MQLKHLFLTLLGTTAAVFILGAALDPPDYSTVPSADFLTQAEATDATWLTATVPSDADGYAYVNVTELLLPARFEHLMETIASLGVEISIDDVRSTYEEEVLPVANNVQGCVGWFRGEAFGGVCLGDFGPSGWSEISDNLAEERASAENGMADGASLGTTDTDFPGLTVHYRIHPLISLFLAGDRLLVIGTETWCRSTISDFAAGGSEGTAPIIGGLTVDTSAVYSGVMVPPEEWMTGIAEGLGIPISITSVQFRLTDVAGGLDLEFRAAFSDETTAQLVHIIMTTAIGEAAAADPESFAMMGPVGLEMLTDALRVEGNSLVGYLDAEMMLGLLSAIAIPAYLKYIARAKTVEATLRVRRLFDSSVAYYDRDHVTSMGDYLPAQFPASVPRTPATVPCGDRAEPSAADWDDPTWQALNFMVSDPHYFSYQYDSQGTGVGATFTASAFGDLDCDGVLSTFVRVGSVRAGNEVRGGAGLYQYNELE
jgi:hypothetical protein